MKKAIFIAAVLAGALAACSKYDCTQTDGKCPGDATPSATDVNRCNAWLDDPYCGAEFHTYGTCVLDNEECSGDAGGNFLQASTSCPNEYKAWQDCCAANLDAGACPFVL